MAVHQAPPPLGFSRQEHCSELPFPSPMHESEKWKWSRSVVSDPQWPHGLQPSRLLHPWDFPGKSPGVGCHCFLRQNLLELTPKKRCPFHHRGLECKSRESRDTWSNRQVWPWSTKWSRAKANRVLPRERTGQSKHPLPTTQDTTLHMDITRWSIQKSDCLYSLQPKMEKLDTVSKNKNGNWLWLRLWAPYSKIQALIEESRENH